jgi:acetyl esterase/lipase
MMKQLGGTLPDDPGKTVFGFADVEDLPLQKGLPDPFLMPDGKRVQTRQDWRKQREYIKAMLAHYLYGHMPPRPKEIEIGQVGSESIYNGRGVEERYTLTIRRKGKSVTCRFLIVRPSLKKRYPTIIKNDRVSFDASPERSDLSQSFDPGSEAVKRGYLLCRFHRTDLAADTRTDSDTSREAGRKAGVYPLYPEYDWGALAVWGWGHGVVLDALDQLGVADMNKVVATGHSRGGKTALCAGIYDERIAITAPNSSGTGGTGSLRYFEEGQRPQTIRHHIGKNQHWLHPRYFQFADKEDRLPFDAHFAKAVIAPRALVNCHARQDYWANPYGTELTHRAAEVVFEWLGAGDRIGLHWREGGHAQNEEDWAALLDFADHHFFDKKTDRRFDNWNYPDAELPFDWKAPDVAPPGGWEDAVLILEAGPRPPANQRTNTNRNQPTMSTEDLLKRTPDGVTVLPDIAYRQGNEAWKLDLAMPRERGGAPRPAIVYIHGGGWTKGDKRGKGIGSVLGYAAKGFVCISVNYRLDVDKKACVEDVKCAVRWLRAHAKKYNVDPNRIGAAGNSAGGHLALMLAVCPASAGLEGDGPYQQYSSMVQSAHCSSTPIMPGFRGSRGKGADPDVKKIQPMTYISGDVPPLYFIHGTEDTKAPVRYVDDFVKALRQAGAKDITYAREAFLARTLRK